MKNSIRNLLSSIKKVFSGPLCISLVYFVFGFLWILFSDKALLRISHSKHFYAEYQTYKGWIYVFVTTLLIFILLKIYTSLKNRAMSDLQASKQELARNLHEKETLIKEIHHRVKNNLQMIISLLRMKARYAESPGLEQTIREISEKLFSIALIHNKLYMSGNLARIDFLKYAKEMCAHIVDMYSMRKAIELKFDVHPIHLAIDTAVPCGIIINELVTNSCKYAFNKNHTGIITIKFKKTGNDLFLLGVHDNGTGFEPPADRANTDTFGMNLLHILAEQLGGTLDIQSDSNGTSAEIVFGQAL